MMQFISKFRFPLILGMVVLVLCLTNYTPGTWLTGWDNLHSEFDHVMNIKRSLFSVWEEYQGTGLLAGMAHAANLVREVFLWLISPIMPQIFIRYFFHFLMLFTGTFGMFYAIRFFLRQHAGASVAALFGALFYLLNLGSVQYFFVPFEPYSTFWGFFPWLMLVLLQYLDSPTKRNLIILAVLNLLATPQALVQTVFVVYLLCVGAVLAISFWQKNATLKQAILLLLIILGLNSFWLIPNAFFTVTDVKVTQNAMNNKMNVERFFQVNKRLGTIGDFALLRENYVDFIDSDIKTEKSIYLMQSWRDHFNNPLVSVIGYAFFAIALYGLTRKSVYRPLWLIIFGICSVAFLSDTIIFSAINELLRAAPLVNQIFRNPFTKFIVPTVFVLSVGFGQGVYFLNEELNKRKQNMGIYLAALLVIAFAIYSFPAFRGQYISSQMRIVIPKEYLDLFAYFRTQDKNGRIMNLPQNSYWGWGAYSWGSKGSGFLWYGIEQPIMDRAFDVWSDELEGYYWQLMNALRKEDQTAFNQVITKYQIRYVLFDPTYIPSDPDSAKLLLKQDKLLKNNPLVASSKQFGRMTVYIMKQSPTFVNNLALTSTLPKVAPQPVFEHADEAFQNLGFYQESTPSADHVFPFSSLFTSRFANEQPFIVQDQPGQFVLSTTVPAGSYQLSYPQTLANNPLVPVQISAKASGSSVTLRFETLLPQLSFNNQKLWSTNPVQETTITAPGDTFILSINDTDFLSISHLTDEYKVIGSTHLLNDPYNNQFKVYSATPSDTFALAPADFTDVKSCVPNNGAKITTERTPEYLRVTTTKASACVTYGKPLTVPGNSLIQASFTYQSTHEEVPKFCYYNDGVKNCLNQKDTNHIGFSRTAAPFTEYFEKNTDAPANEYFTLIVERFEDKYTQAQTQLQFSNLSLSAYPFISAFALSAGQSQQTTTQVPLELSKPATLQVVVPKVHGSYSLEDLIKTNRYKKNQLAVNELKDGDFTIQEKPAAEPALRLYAKDTFLNFWFDLPGLPTNQGYITSFDAKNVSGFPLMVNFSTLTNTAKYAYTMTDKTADFSKQTYILPPYSEFDNGLRLLFNDNSFNRIPAVNEIRNVSVYPFPYSFVTGITLTSTLATPLQQYPIQATKQNYSGYTATIPAHSTGTLILSQAFDKGWKAYMNGKELSGHVRVNGWENGWNLQTGAAPATVTIVFWPQYLEFAGFALLILTLIAVTFI